jgi:hypothetical protein
MRDLFIYENHEDGGAFFLDTVLGWKRLGYKSNETTQYTIHTKGGHFHTLSAPQFARFTREFSNFLSVIEAYLTQS